MKKWNKKDIGKIILYRGEKGLDEKVTIYDVDSRTPNRIGFVEYPIALDSDIHPLYLSSRIGIVGLIKNQRKESKEYLEKAGDWCFIDKVSGDEMRELKRIARISRDISEIA
jgi:hypothetical protein